MKSKQKQHKYRNYPHIDPLKDRLPAETLLALHQLRETPEVQARPVIDNRP